MSKKTLHNQTGRWIIDVYLEKMVFCLKSVTSEARCSGEIGSFLIFGFPSLRLHASTSLLLKCFLQGFLIPSDWCIQLSPLPC